MAKEEILSLSEAFEGTECPKCGRGVEFSSDWGLKGPFYYARHPGCGLAWRIDVYKVILTQDSIPA